MKIKMRIELRIKKLLKNENGVTLPILTLLVVFVLIGVMILVIDAAELYGERRSLVSAADSAALAGSKVIEQELGAADMSPAKVLAEKVAKDIAVANGVKNRDDIVVTWNRINYDGADRDVITVTVKNGVSLIFPRLWGDKSTDVTAKAVATWGYVVKLEGGDILPIFTKASSYQATSTTYLHAGKFVDDMGDVVNGNWGLIDIFGNGGDISRAFAGELVEKNWELNYSIDNQTGLTAGKVARLETRMQTANALPLKEDRIKYMTAMVPVIDFSKITQQGSSLSLPIQTFAVFEIYDVIMTEGNDGNKRSEGSQYAMYDNVNYLSDGIEKVYEMMDGTDLDKCTIIGKFTGETVEVRAVVEPGDQENPDPAIISAKYSKLIK